MGFYAGYGIAVISYVQMAVICYTGQNVVDRVNSDVERTTFLKDLYISILHAKCSYQILLCRMTS